ncbi:MAG: hypothetical protein QOE61_5672, partial [Micromonosporaceae bacterium]|nr:hypothetical protein [Micromonosporaceae bacterium]
MRAIQRGTRSDTYPNGINPTTIHDALCSPKLARWEVVRSVTSFLGGDLDEVEGLWKEAHDAQTRVGRRAAGELPGATSLAAQHYGQPRGVEAHATARPWQLPADVFGFTGRTETMLELDQLASPRELTTALAIATLVGPAGVGKTALAVHWAHGAADRFPDGCLYMDLRGSTSGRPVSPEMALARFLRSLGVPRENIPDDLAEGATSYRSLMASRRTLVVLDDVAAVDQVRPLLPGAPQCFVLATSRAPLPDLVARDGARRISVGRLHPFEATALLRTLIGTRDAGEPSAVETLAEACGGHPVAVRVAA